MNPLYKIHLAARRWLPAGLVFKLSLRYLLILNWLKYREWNFPVTIAIETNAHCNRRCYYCPQSVSPTKPKTIQPHVYDRILDRVAELGWSGILDFHFFGEPLLNKNLEWLVHQARRQCPKAVLEILSNGDALTVERTQSLIDAGIDKFIITRHPPFKPEWDTRIIYVQRRFPRHVFYRTIEDNPLVNRTGMVKPKVSFDFSHGCFQASRHLQIDIEGKYVFCCSDYEKRHLMGDVFQHDILQAWNHPAYKAARKSVERGQPVLDVCKACFSGKPIPPDGEAVKLVCDRCAADGDEYHAGRNMVPLGTEGTCHKCGAAVTV